MGFSPYQALEVLEIISVADRKGGRSWFVRDDDEAQFWCLVEYMDRRLVCWCDDGVAHHESMAEPECRHLAAVLADLALSQRSSRPHGTLVPALFVE